MIVNFLAKCFLTLLLLPLSFDVSTIIFRVVGFTFKEPEIDFLPLVLLVMCVSIVISFICSSYIIKIITKLEKYLKEKNDCN
jgi:hypothetical protein